MSVGSIMAPALPARARPGHPWPLGGIGAGGVAWLPLVLVFVLAAGLRLGGLDGSPLWGDEAATAGFAGLPWPELFWGVGRIEPNPPTFYALEKLWTGLAGGSDLALRLPCALFGIAGVAAVWRLTRDAFGVRAAQWTALLLSINALHLEHSRDARVYALLFLTVAGGALVSRRIACAGAARGMVRPGVALALLTGVCLWLHHTGAIAMACVYVYAGVGALHRAGPRRERVMALLAAGLVGLGAGAPSLLGSLAIAADKTNNATWIPVPDALMAGMFTVTTWTSSYAGLRLFDMGVLVGLLGVGLVVIAHAFGWALLRARGSADAAGLLAGAVAAVGLMAGISQVVPVMVEKTLLFSLVFFLPLLGATLAALPLAWRSVLVAVVLLLQVPGLVTVFAAARHGEDWAGLATALGRESGSTGWPVVVRSGFDAVSIERYAPPGSPARPLVAILPRIGTRLNQLVAERMSGARPVSEQAAPAGLCARLADRAGAAPSGVLLVDRRNPVLERERVPATALLAASGGRLAGETTVGSLIIQRWPGVCAPRHG